MGPLVAREDPGSKVSIAVVVVFKLCFVGVPLYVALTANLPHVWGLNELVPLDGTFMYAKSDHTMKILKH